MTTNKKPAHGWHREAGLKQLSLGADYTPDKVAETRQRLRDAITATGLPVFQSVAIFSAAESYAKAVKQAAFGEGGAA